MRFPKLTPERAERTMLTVFRGYNAGERIGEEEFEEMVNLTSDRFPRMSPRQPRGRLPVEGSIQGLIAKDGLCYVEGSRFVVNGYPVELGLSQREEDCPKGLVSMGGYVVIFPDKKYINTLDLTDFGNLEAEYRGENVTVAPCDGDGKEMLPAYVQPEEPGSPENGELWLDNSSLPGSLMQWSTGSGMWIPVETSFVKLSAPKLGVGFRTGDGVSVDGTGLAGGVIQTAGEDYVVLPGLAERVTTAAVTVKRWVPEMDFVIECGNRLWGCRYGFDRDGRVVNEIYASKLGDFRNWNCFQGTAADSYAVSLGEDGVFTGAIQHLGYPLFFRENCMHKVYGSYPASFRLQTTPCRGVQRGSGRSLAIVGEVLYYKSPQGVCAYDGALPVEVGQALGTEAYRAAAAGDHRGKYYLSMADAGGEYHLFVLDTVRKLWHREDNTRVREFCSCREELYFLDGDGHLRTVLGSGEPEGAVQWMAQTGPIGADSPDAKVLAKLTLRLWLERESAVRIAVRYDEEPVWQPVTVLRGTGLGSVTLPLGVRRCDHLRLRFSGMGPMALHSITKTMVQGSDVF